MDGDGSFSAPFKFIEDAIHRVSEYGDTIRLQAGTYVENNLFFTATDQSQTGGQPGGGDPQQHLVKEIAIIGSGAENTILDANFGGAHFTFDALEKVFIRGITLTKGFSDNYGGSIQTNNVDSLAIKNVIFNDSKLVYPRSVH